MIREEQIFKPTEKNPVSVQSKNLVKNFKKDMNKYAPNVAPNIRLNEIDAMLSEAEMSLKKKIFSLAKMEALVFSDPRLSAVYDDMSINGEEKYGYHYNETIMNMIFNDYVLNSPKYLQKYKIAIPKEKKRRDQSGINQLKKAGEERMKKTDPEFKPKKLDKSGLPKQEKSLTENDEEISKVQFLVNEEDPENPDVFAYFPEENYDKRGAYRVGYSHIGQHSAVHPDYAAQSRPATPEEYADLKAELESIGYNLEMVNQTNETTSAGSAGGAAGYVGYAAPLGYDKKVDETTSAGSAGGAAGYVGYAGPAAWGSGDLMKTKGKSKVMRKPIFPGGTIIAESNYLTDPSGFEKYINLLNEVETSMDAPIIDKTNAFTSDTVKGWNVPDKQHELDIVKTGAPDKPNLNVVENADPNKISTKEELKAFVTQKRATTGKGLGREDVPKLAGDALYAVAVGIADKMLPMGWDGLADVNSMWDYIRANGGMSYDQLKAAVKRAVNVRLKEEGYSLKDLGLGEAVETGDESELGKQTFNKGDKVFDKLHNTQGTVLDNYDNPVDGDMGDVRLDSDGNVPVYQYDKDGKKIGYNLTKVSEGLDEKAKSPAQQRLFGMAHAAQKGDIPMSKLKGSAKKIAQTVDPEDVEDFASTKHDEIKEETQTMIGDNGSSMALDPTPKNKIGGGTPMGMQSGGGGGGMSENKNLVKNNNIMDTNEEKLLEELDKELEAYSIHHNKLKIMAEDKKPSSLVMKDRLGAENEKNFKKDLQHSGTKEIIDVEKELQWKDQQTDVDDPQKLGQDLEKKEIKVTDAEGEEHLKNVGDSANDKGDEIPKRNRTDDEQHDVDMHRLGQQDLVYDNEPGKRFEDRMKADMGDKLYKERQEKMKWRSEAPMYNKDPQPTENTDVDKDQFNKEKSTWNKRDGLEETMITGRFTDALGKKYIKDFRLNEVKELKTPSGTARQTGLFELDFTGFGNKYKGKTQDKKVLVNEGVDAILSENKFFTDGKEVFALKNPVQKLNEVVVKTKPVVNEQYEKMKHLTGYKPESFTDTNNVKKNRGF